MNKSFSTLLDLARLSAALLVFFGHAEQILKDHRLSQIASFGHDAVILFFILSGFVIAYVSNGKEKTLTDYTIARLARIYSVTVPSLILVYVLYMLGQHFSPHFYVEYPKLFWLKIFLSSTFFLNQSLGLFVPTNDPFWSVCYEVWYYVIFGIVFYVKGHRKYIFLVSAMILAGYKILMLMPIWIVGYLCFAHHQKLKASAPVGYLLIILSTGIYLTLRVLNIDNILFNNLEMFLGGEQKTNEALGWSKHFIFDYVVALLCVLFFSGIYIIVDNINREVLFCKKTIKTLSAYTFSLYLYHYPIILFLSSFIDSTVLILSICLALIILLGFLSERKKSTLADCLKKCHSAVCRFS